VLVIQQKRLVHAQIPEVLQRIEIGDSTQMGQMGGGFGGGMF